MVTPVRDILKREARAWGLQPAVRLATARANWRRIVGPALAALSAPLAVREGRLEIAVTHPAAAQEIRLRAAAIADAVNRALEERAVTAVVPVARRRLPDVGPPRERRERERTRGPRAQSGRPAPKRG
jgi:predicted nucleic acid-binding Zn ribbon protein